MNGFSSEKMRKRKRCGCILAQGLGRLLGRHGANPRFDEGPIEAEIDLGDPRDRGETLLVVRTIDAEGAYVVERPGLQTEEILAVDELAVLGSCQ